MIDRRRPIRSESGPQSQTPAATAATTAEIVSPVPAGPTWKVRPMSGRIAWVEYIVANIPALPSRKPAIAPTRAAPGRTPASAAASPILRRYRLQCQGNTVARSHRSPLTPHSLGG